jgi:hypothetical protein
MEALANKPIDNIILHAKLCKTPSALALDCWTNCTQAKVLNVLLLAQTTPYFLKTIENNYESVNGEFLFTNIAPIIEDLHSRGVKIVGIVMDNASVNLKLYECIQEIYPHFIRLPCTAHIVQLCVHKILKVPSIQKVINFMELILSTFRSTSALHNKLKTLQCDDIDLTTSTDDIDVAQSKSHKHVYPLLRPNDTRWSSFSYISRKNLFIKTPYYLYCQESLHEDYRRGRETQFMEEDGRINTDSKTIPRSN